MTKKIRGSEKMLFTCEKNGKRSLADFENVEEALQASGGMRQPADYLNIWEILGKPSPEILGKRNLEIFQNLAVMKQPNTVRR